MSNGSKGWVGSIAVHLGILGAIVGFSWYASHHSSEVVDDSKGGIDIDLNGVPGKRPGEVGKAVGVAKGSEAGTKSGVPILHLKKLDVAKTLREREQAEQAAEPAPSSPKSIAKTKPKTAPSSKGGGKMSLDDFNKQKGVKGGAGKTGGIGGVTMRKVGERGVGDNGGEGGVNSEQALYVADVQTRLGNAWNSLLAAEGASIGSPGSCGVTVAIDASGFASFSGWLTRPGDARMAELVKRACAMIGNCGKPPSGKAFKIDFSKISANDG